MEVPKALISLIGVVSEICFLFNHPRGICKYRINFEVGVPWKASRITDLVITRKLQQPRQLSVQTGKLETAFFWGRAVAVGKNGKSLSIPLSDPCSNEIFVLNNPSFLWIRLPNGLMEKAYLMASYQQVASPIYIYTASKQMIKGYERLLGNISSNNQVTCFATP